MPDISMCPSQDCPSRGGCYRNEASGTRPCEWRQSWIGFTWREVGDGAAVLCDGYWPREGWGDRRALDQVKGEGGGDDGV